MSAVYGRPVRRMEYELMLQINFQTKRETSETLKSVTNYYFKLKKKNHYKRNIS